MAWDIQAELESLLRSKAELERRTASAGFRGLDELLSMQQRIQAALQGIDLEEIDRALAELEQLLAGARQLDRTVRDLAKAKENVAGAEEI